METKARQQSRRALATRTRSQPRSNMRRQEARWGLFFISPWILGYLIFTLGPMIVSLYLSFTQYDALSPPQWVGLANYKRMVADDELFLKALGVTFSYTLFFVPFGVAGSLLVAILLNQPIKARTFYRAMFYIPTITPVVAAIFLWQWMLNPEYGPVNFILSEVGITGPRWFSDPTWARPTLIVFALWAYVGGGPMVVFLAALQSIPTHLYEAARIDGAGRLRQFFHITLPMLSPTIFYSLILAVVGSFQVFEAAYAGTNGGPVRSTYFYVLHLYFTAFRYFEMGYASALAWVLFIILLVFTLVQFRYASKWVHYESEV